MKFKRNRWNYYWTVGNICLLLLGACASKESLKEVPVYRGAYLSDLKNISVNIVYERGRNSHRFFLMNDNVSPHVHIFHDRQLFKSLKIKEDIFRELLTKSLDTAETLERKPARKTEAPCRTPFFMTLKNAHETHTVEGCRGSEEGVMIGKFIAEIEYMIFQGEANN